MRALLNPANFQYYLLQVQDWLMANLFTLASAVQIAAILATFLVGKVVARLLRQVEVPWGQEASWYQRSRAVAAPLVFPVVWLVLLWLSALVAAYMALPYYLLRVVSSLLAAWIVIRLVANVVRNRQTSQIVAWVAWTFAALNITGLLDPTIAILDGAAVQMGEVRLSVLSVISTVLSLAILIWAALLVTKIFEQRITRSTNLTPSLQVLFTKLFKISLLTVAVVVGLATTGVDLTAFAVFSGALGVGIGFGLQKVISNLISGVILLMDRSIKPGDVIELGTTYGRINKLAARYISVITRSGYEHLIPNEEFISQPVINWTHSDRQIRRVIPIGVSYKADLRKAIKLVAEAAAETPRVLDRPPPVCLVKGFGDNSVDLELRFWIDDPENGVSNVASAALLNVWDKFQEHDIQIPYPQRDIHIITPLPSGENILSGTDEDENPASR